MFKKIFISLLVMLVIALAFGFLFLKFSKIPEPFTEDSASAAWSENGSYDVAEMNFTLRDETRETQAHEYFAQFDGLPYRQLESTVWFPKSQEEGRFPLIVYSHGFMSDRADMRYALQHLSSRGYVVLAANYPLTSNASGDALLMADVVNQPADIHFLVDQITNPVTDVGKTFSHLIDDAKIGVMGYSLGGLTSTLVAYHPEHLHPRIQAVVSIAGASAMLGEQFYQTNNIPFMMIAGTADRMTPYGDHAAVVVERVKNSVLVEIARGSHMGFAGMGSFLRWTNNPDSFACYLMNMKMDSMGIDRGAEERAWYPLLGTAEQGVIYDDPSIACDPDGAEREALNPLRQQMLTKVAVASFFEGVFSSSPKVREKAKGFLENDFPAENADVHVIGTLPLK